MSRNVLKETIYRMLLKEVRVCPSDIDGTGLFPKSSFSSGERLFPLFRLVKDDAYFERRDAGLPVLWPHDVTWEDHTWNINHQKNSSCSIEKDGDVWYCISKKPLSKEDEITVNYEDMPSFVNRSIKDFIETV